MCLTLPGLALSAGSVAQAKLGKGIVEREVSEETSAFSLNETAYLWMRVVDGEGETVTVTWSTGEQSFDVQLPIGSNSWRTLYEATLTVQ